MLTNRMQSVSESHMKGLENLSYYLQLKLSEQETVTTPSTKLEIEKLL